jgi:hypothetical protein
MTRLCCIPVDVDSSYFLVQDAVLRPVTLPRFARLGMQQQHQQTMHQGGLQAFRHADSKPQLHVEHYVDTKHRSLTSRSNELLQKYRTGTSLRIR